MASSARQLPDGTSNPVPAPAELLIQLRAAHDQLLLAMETMDCLTLGPFPEARELSAARWRIGQANLHRRSISARVLDYIAGRADGCETRRIRLLKLESQLVMSTSAKHVYSWSNEAIARDWKGYCRASRAIRMQMKSNLLMERQLLYPILEELAGRRR